MDHQFTPFNTMTVQSAVLPSIVSVMSSNCQDCTGVLHKMWLVGYLIYFAWMAICMSFVIIGSLYELFIFEDWTSTVPLGFMQC